MRLMTFDQFQNVSGSMCLRGPKRRASISRDHILFSLFVSELTGYVDGIPEVGVEGASISLSQDIICSRICRISKGNRQRGQKKLQQTTIQTR